MAKNKKKQNSPDAQGKRSRRFKAPAFIQKRSFRYGSAATLFTVVFIVGVILVNVLVSSLSARFPISFDMTASQKSALSQKSIQYVKKVDQNVYIDILTDESTYANASNYNAALRIMQQYGQYNPKIHLDYINLNKNPTYAAKYSKETLSEADIIVRSGDRYKHIASSDLIETSSDSSTGATSVTANNTEQQIDSALAYVTTKDLPTILVTSGHGEADVSSFTALLQKNNYTVETKNPATDGIDQNASMVVVATPSADFTADEITKLDTYLKNGGKYGKNVLLIFDPTQAKVPNLESFAKKWGITVGSGVVYETNSSNIYSGSSGSNPFNFIEGDLDSTYTGSIKSDMHALVSAVRPLTLDFTSQGKLTTDAVITTSSTTKLWNPPDLSTATTFNASDSARASDKSGPFDVMALSTDSETSGSSTVKSNVLVLGSTNFLDSTVLSESSLSNSTIMLNTLSNVIGFKPGITVESKDLTTQSLTVTASQEVAIVLIFAIVLPIAILVAGIYMWVRRKNQ